MKKFMLKTRLHFLAVVLVFFGAMLFSSTEAQAQNTDIPINQSQNLTWVSESEAMSLLENQLIVLENSLAGLVPGSPAYIDAVNHFVYYKLIYTDIEGGLSTEQSTNTNLFNVPNENGTKDDAPSQINLNQLYADAVGLLTV